MAMVLAWILKLPVKSVLPKWSEVVQSAITLYEMVQNGNSLQVKKKNRNYLSKWRAWQVLAKALPVAITKGK